VEIDGKRWEGTAEEFHELAQLLETVQFEE